MGGTVGETKFNFMEDIMKNKVVKIKKEYYRAMKQMTDKQIAEFVKGLCDYVYEGKPFVTKDSFLKGVAMYVKRDLDVAEQNARNGKKGAEALAKKKSEAAGGIEIVVVAGQNSGADV